MTLSTKILNISRRPSFRASLMSTLIAAAGVSVANQPGHAHDSQMQKSQAASDHKKADYKKDKTYNSQASRDSQGTMTDQTQNTPSFSQVDADRDGKLVWTEIYAIYDDELNEANWDQTTAYRTYDVDRNNALSDQEYILFVSGLSDIPSADLDAQSADAQQKRQDERRQAAEQARQQPDSMDQQRSASTASSQQQDQMRTQDQQRSNAQVKDRNAQQQTSAQAQNNPSQQQNDNAPPVSVLTVTTITTFPVESLKDMEVINSYGEEIGEVEHVLTKEDGTIDGLVVGVGGFWDIGDKDVRVSADELRISGDYIVWDTPLNEEQLDNLPEYDGDELSVAY